MRQAAAHPGRERWLVSYADFITLLFAFFTTLYAISTIDARKLHAMVESMQDAFRAGALTAEPAPSAGGVWTPGATGGRPLGGLQERIVERLGRAIADRRVEVGRDRRGIVVSISEAGSFASGSADLSAEARELLTDLGGVLAETDNQVRVEGHTDNTPIHNARFASNWELSTARATNVIAFLIETTHARPERFSASGYAEYHPRADNTTDANRRRNRRVDIVILDPEVTAGEEPSR